ETHDELQNVSQLFDNWAEINRDVGMEEGHYSSVISAIDKVILPQPLRFLDIGCGNGWLVHFLSTYTAVDYGIGLDISEKMIRKARERFSGPGLQFYTANFLEWEPPVKFNFIISMEAFYYINPMENIFNKLKTCMLPGGKLLVGTDYYRENPGSADWGKDLNLSLDRRSREQWRSLFAEAGFTNIWQINITAPESGDGPDWKRKYGTLFTGGTFSAENLSK
ncbi:MAG: class I SAM-dependent methyltransferase, partial [Calditrichia bacterium]